MTAIADPPTAPDVPNDAPVALDVAPFAPVATLSADLMPDEIVVKRRLAYLKRRLVFVMVALVALVVLGDLLVRQQTRSAQSDLGAANNQIATLTEQVNHFNGMLAVQGETQAIRTQLDGVMGTDVSWPQLLGKLAAPAPTGVHLTSISAQVDDPSASGATPDPTSVVPDSAGSITLVGTAHSWTQVAAYVRGLSATKGFTAVNPSAVSDGSSGSAPASSGSLSFTVTLDLTSAALSNRYATATATTPTVTGTGATATPADTQTPASSGSTASHTSPRAGSAPHHHAHHARHHRNRRHGATAGTTGPTTTTQEAS